MIELLSINIRFTLILKLTASSSFLSFIEFPLIFKIFIRTYFFILETTISLVKRTKEKISSVQLSIPALVSFHLGRQTNTPFFFFFLIQHAVIIERRIKDYTTYTIPYLLPSSSNILMLQIGEKKKIFHSPICIIFLTKCGFSTIVFYQIERHYYSLASFVGRMTKIRGIRRSLLFNVDLVNRFVR